MGSVREERGKRLKKKKRRKIVKFSASKREEKPEK